MDKRIFISCVTDEFGDFRKDLRSHLTAAGCDVRTMEDFPQDDVDILEKLDRFIRDCDAVIHIMGTRKGGVAEKDTKDRYLEAVPDFLTHKPELRHELRDFSNLSFTQWEALMAIHHQRRIRVYHHPDVDPDYLNWLNMGLPQRFGTPFEEVAEILGKLIGDLRRILPNLQEEFVSSSSGSNVNSEAKSTDDGRFNLSRNQAQRARSFQFRKKIRKLSGEFRNEWAQIDSSCSDDCSVENMHSERVQLADDYIVKLLKEVEHENGARFENYSVVARGGYGLGQLSYGSNIDLCFVCSSPQPDGLFDAFMGALTDFVDQIPELSYEAPSLTTQLDLLVEWCEADVEDCHWLESLTSSSSQRLVAGEKQGFQGVEFTWTEFVSDMDRSLVGDIVQKIKERVGAPIDSDSEFDCKEDSGGMLDARIAIFLENIAEIRETEIPADLDFLNAYRCLLALRDYKRESFDWNKFELFKNAELSKSSDEDVSNEISTKLRSKVLARLSDLVQILEKENPCSSGRLKLVEAIIKPFKLEEVHELLSEIEIGKITMQEVKGFGRQKGHTEIYRGSEYTVDFLPKVKISMVVPERRTGAALTAIKSSASTNKIGDGKIFVSWVDSEWMICPEGGDLEIME